MLMRKVPPSNGEPFKTENKKNTKKTRKKNKVKGKTKYGMGWDGMGYGMVWYGNGDGVGDGMGRDGNFDKKSVPLDRLTLKHSRTASIKQRGEGQTYGMGWDGMGEEGVR